MSNVSSIIDGSMAIAGLIAVVWGWGWAMMASESGTTVETQSAADVPDMTAKKVA
jgi:hypothetical protein